MELFWWPRPLPDSLWPGLGLRRSGGGPASTGSTSSPGGRASPRASPWGGQLATSRSGFADLRPSLRQISQQPGMIASSAVCLSVFIGAIVAIPTIVLAFSKPVSYTHELENILVSVMSNAHIAHSVAAAWMAQILTATWRAERGWIDQTGQALGIFWIGRFVAQVGRVRTSFSRQNHARFATFAGFSQARRRIEPILRNGSGRRAVRSAVCLTPAGFRMRGGRGRALAEVPAGNSVRFWERSSRCDVSAGWVWAWSAWPWLPRRPPSLIRRIRTRRIRRPHRRRDPCFTGFISVRRRQRAELQAKGIAVPPCPRCRRKAWPRRKTSAIVAGVLWRWSRVRRRPGRRRPRPSPRSWRLQRR